MIRYPYDTADIAIDADGVRSYPEVESDLVSMLRARANDHPDRAAVTLLGGPTLTYADLWKSAARVAGGLRSDGLSPGDRVAIKMHNCVEWVIAYWGVQLAGCVVVTIGHRLTDHEAEFIVADSGARLVLDDPHLLPDGPPVATQDLRGESTAALFYTSGTTGRPKGVVITHHNATQNAENQRRMVALGLGAERPRCLIAVPLSHITGCNSQMVSTIHAGGTSVILESFSNGAVRRAVSEHELNFMVAVPTIYWRMVTDPEFSAEDFDSIRALSYGGAPTPPELVRQIQSSFPQAYIQNGFGSTECSGIHTALPGEFAVSHSSSVGLAMPTADILIDQPDANGVGEILVRGPNITPGYWNRPDAMRESFTRDGWFRMGDLGRLDQDGFLFVVDRIKDMISRGGEKIFCGEVENCIAEVPEIMECAVVGVPDVELGERVGVVLVPRDGEQVSVEAVVAHLAAHVAGYKIPEYWQVLSDPLPRNAGGKILKTRLKQEVDWASIPVHRRPRTGVRAPGA